MDPHSIFTVFSMHFTRFAIDAFICWVLYYLYCRKHPLANVLEEERQRMMLRDYAEMETQIPFGPGETVETHAERKMALTQVRTAILVQQVSYRTGLQCRQWFLDEIGMLPVNRWGSARELEEGRFYPRDMIAVGEEAEEGLLSDSETL